MNLIWFYEEHFWAEGPILTQQILIKNVQQVVAVVSVVAVVTYYFQKPFKTLEFSNNKAKIIKNNEWF